MTHADALHRLTTICHRYLTTTQMATLIRTKDYRSDIVLTLHMTLGGETVNVPQHDFLLRFFTEHEARHYDCGRIKGEWLHCTPDESDTTLLTCYIKNHGLGCGMLQCLYIDLSPNDGMEDGVQRTFSVSGIDLELVDDASDDTQAVDGTVVVDINAVLTELHDAADAAIASQQKNIASISYIGSNVDGGANTIVITKNDGTRVTGTVYNGHTGATGPQGIQGIKGDKGDKGDPGEGLGRYWFEDSSLMVVSSRIGYKDTSLIL